MTFFLRLLPNIVFQVGKGIDRLTTADQGLYSSKKYYPNAGAIASKGPKKPTGPLPQKRVKANSLRTKKAALLAAIFSLA